MINALWITLIGMSLVFAAILLLWGLMALLVRVTAERQTAGSPPLEAAVEPDADAGMSAIPSESLDLERKRRAAAAAVTVVMALQKSNGTARKSEPAVSISAWQAVHRASQLSRQVNGPRKKVVR